jgi:hypothetical protein
MTLPSNRNDREHQKFVEATDVAGLPAIAVVNPDGSSIGSGGVASSVTVTALPADPLGANADAIVAAGATGSISAKLRRVTQGLEDLKSLLVLAAGSNLIGAVRAFLDVSTLYDGTTALTPKFATISTSSSGATSVVAAVASKKLRVLRLSLVANGAVNVKFQSASTDRTGLYYLGANGGWVEPFCPVGIFETAAGEALNVNLSGAVAVGGSLTYVEV